MSEQNIVDFCARWPKIRSFWYLGSPYTRYEARGDQPGIFAAFDDVCLAAAYLIRRGVPVYSPIAHTHPIAIMGGIDPLDHSIWLPADQPMMDAAGGLIVVKMPGWQESKGVQHEIEAFEVACKPIGFMQWPLPNE